ncbi:MAG TPA: ribosome small subunit-dependent GTPase A [Candidatus Nanopelagicales bacterium]|nr:ribosome small subunit-dependent GTPase A [Candidatus Nanopelagicales bacterium]
MSTAGAPAELTGLAALGWDAAWQAAFVPMDPELVPARVVGAHRGTWEVATGAPGGPLEARATGRLRHEAGPAELPVVGDWVAVDARPDEGAATVHAVLPRRTQLRRKAPVDHGTPFQVLAANVDVVFVATSLNRELNPRRVERYLAMAWESGALPVVVLTKVDLARDPVEVAVAEAQLEEVAAGVAVVATSAVSGEGLEAIRAFLGAGRTVALVGSSGVGKSTLANALLGEERLLVREIREDDARGRHTTVGRQLVALPGGAGLLLDTPGLRELGLWDDGTGLDLAFAEVVAAAAACRFSDCRHEGEPGCAVRAAIDEGALAADRFEGWRKLAKEERFRALEMDAVARRTERKRWAAIGKAGAARANAKRGEWGR